MIVRRPANERGHFNHGWLDTYHSFSFGDYQDPQHMGFRTLRVINDDVVQPGGGFDLHPHRDMEIITYVVDGALEHRDNLGNGGVIPAGGFQVMTAGRGIVHGEFNPSQNTPVRLIQIWIRPAERGLAPSYQDRPGPIAAPADWDLVAAPDATDGALPIHQDVRLYHRRIAAGQSLRRELAAGRHAWVQVVDGAVTVNGTAAERGDGIALTDEAAVEIVAQREADLLLFDLA